MNDRLATATGRDWLDFYRVGAGRWAMDTDVRDVAERIAGVETEARTAAWAERSVLAKAEIEAARADALKPYVALAEGALPDEELYRTDPVYHATVYRMLPPEPK